MPSNTAASRKASPLSSPKTIDMKMLMALLICVALVLVSCDLLRSKPDVQAFIPGVYVARWNSAYADSHDTLQILPQMSGTTIHYAIIRRTFHRYQQGRKPVPPKYTIDHWTASYAPREGTLLIHRSGRVLSFDPAKRQLTMGAIVYQKLSN